MYMEVQNHCRNMNADICSLPPYLEALAITTGEAETFREHDFSCWYWKSHSFSIMRRQEYSRTICTYGGTYKFIAYDKDLSSLACLAEYLSCKFSVNDPGDELPSNPRPYLIFTGSLAVDSTTPKNTIKCQRQTLRTEMSSLRLTT